ncbi:sensor histidine kinase [Aestuariibius sp. 2305UL40-4]|uniref:sensor histidine kinase n=1 Tax=Aestuariibius violaceus TaxID=3234132 RepID=UPI00345E675A
MNANSIRVQLSLRFVLLALLGIAAASYMAVRQIAHIDDLVQEVALGHQAQDLADALVLTDDGSLTLDLPEKLLRLYEMEHSGAIFAIRNARGDLLFVDGDNALEVLQPGFTFPEFFDFFQAVDMSPTEARGLDPTRFGLTERFSTRGGDVFITVAQHKVTDDFLNRAVAIELMDEAVMVGLPFLAVFILLGVGLVRYSTTGLTYLSGKAREIGPQSLRARLPVHAAPAEIAPLAEAFNDAIDRVAEGYEAQKRFTIDAAHQLKTPLAVLRARLQSIPAFEGRALVEDDLDHMDRLVRQLLTSARLSAFELDPSSRMDLSELATEVATSLAPLAIDQGCELELVEATSPVIVAGEAHLAVEALHNLVENAIAHTAPGTTVRIRIHPPSTMEVMDRGPGVPGSEKKHIFMPFGQGRTPTPNGTGMGLAIVRQIMQVHGGTVDVADREGGGAVFSLHFSTNEKPLL